MTWISIEQANLVPDKHYDIWVQPHQPSPGMSGFRMTGILYSGNGLWVCTEFRLTHTVTFVMEIPDIPQGEEFDGRRRTLFTPIGSRMQCRQMIWGNGVEILRQVFDGSKVSPPLTASKDDFL